MQYLRFLILNWFFDRTVLGPCCNTSLVVGVAAVTGISCWNDVTLCGAECLLQVPDILSTWCSSLFRSLGLCPTVGRAFEVPESLVHTVGSLVVVLSFDEVTGFSLGLRYLRKQINSCHRSGSSLWSSGSLLRFPMASMSSRY